MSDDRVLGGKSVANCSDESGRGAFQGLTSLEHGPLSHSKLDFTDGQAGWRKERLTLVMRVCIYEDQGYWPRCKVLVDHPWKLATGRVSRIEAVDTFDIPPGILWPIQDYTSFFTDPRN